MHLAAESRDRNIAEHARSPRIKRLLAMWEGYARGQPPTLTELMEAGLGEMCDHYFILLPDGPERFTFLFYGRAIQRCTGIERTGHTTDELPAAIQRYMVRKYQRVLETGKPLYIVNVASARLHIDTWERLVVPVLTDGEAQLLVVLAEPRQLHETVSTAILEASPDAVLALRAIEDDLGTIYDARIVSANASACRMTRRPREQLLQASFCERFPLTRTNGIWDLCVEVTESHRPVRFDIESALSTMDGPCRITLFPLYGGCALMLQDISDLSGDAIPMIRRRVSNVQYFAAAYEG